jgi:hypothetical protein
LILNSPTSGTRSRRLGVRSRQARRAASKAARRRTGAEGVGLGLAPGASSCAPKTGGWMSKAPRGEGSRLRVSLPVTGDTEGGRRPQTIPGRRCTSTTEGRTQRRRRRASRPDGGGTSPRLDCGHGGVPRGGSARRAGPPDDSTCAGECRRPVSMLRRSAGEGSDGGEAVEQVGGFYPGTRAIAPRRAAAPSKLRGGGRARERGRGGGSARPALARGAPAASAHWAPQRGREPGWPVRGGHEPTRRPGHAARSPAGPRRGSGNRRRRAARRLLHARR